jgi:hypothetical protein
MTLKGTGSFKTSGIMPSDAASHPRRLKPLNQALSLNRFLLKAPVHKIQFLYTIDSKIPLT